MYVLQLVVDTVSHLLLASFGILTAVIQTCYANISKFQHSTRKAQYKARVQRKLNSYWFIIIYIGVLFAMT